MFQIDNKLSVEIGSALIQLTLSDLDDKTGIGYFSIGVAVLLAYMCILIMYYYLLCC